MSSKVQTFGNKSLVYRIFGLAAFGLVIGSALMLNRELTLSVRQQFGRVSRDSEEAVSFRWHPDLYRILSFGHVPASVDWLLIRFLTDGSISKTKDDNETEASRVLNLATEIDPAFFSLYTGGANFLAVARNDRIGARRLIERGAKFLYEKLPLYPQSFRDTEWGDAWRILMIQGYIYLLEFQDAESAAKAYGAMDRYPGLAPGLKGIAESIRTTEGQFRMALNSLGVIKGWYKEDPVMLQELDEKEKFLLLGQALFRWNRDFEKFPRIKKETDSERFGRFRPTQKIPERDSFGGKVFLRENGKIDSDTPRDSVFGIHF